MSAGREESWEERSEDGADHGHACVRDGQSWLGYTPECGPGHVVRSVGVIDGGEDANSDDTDGGNASRMSPWSGFLLFPRKKKIPTYKRPTEKMADKPSFIAMVICSL